MRPQYRFSRRFCLRLAGFLLLVLVPLGAGEIYVRSLPNPAKSKHAYLSRHAGEVETLVLGSSHTYYGLCPELLGPHAYSAAQVSQTWKYDEWVLRHYPFGRLRRVVLPVSDFSFYEELEDGAEWYLATRYRLYMDCDVHPRLSAYGWEFTAFRTFCEKLRSLWQPPRMAWSRTGQGLEYTLAARPADWDNGAARAAHNVYADFAHAPANERRIGRIADFCSSRGATLWLVSTPLTPSYRAHQSARQTRDTQRRLERFLKAHPEVRYLDFRADPLFTPRDFYDADHLNRQGAAKLSRRLQRAMVGEPI